MTAITYVTFLSLLAVTGMRVSEAINLDRCDVGGDEGVLTVRLTKFGKSRELPLHPSTVNALEVYARTRDRLLPLQRSSSFFLSEAGTRLIYNNVHFKFHRLIDRAGLADRRPHRPRIHDLRHTFAIRTLINWYRAGVEVEPRLPVLSTYMGHVSPTSTYWYLTAVPELLALVSERAERAHEVRS
jgi:integrase